MDIALSVSACLRVLLLFAVSSDPTWHTQQRDLQRNAAREPCPGLCLNHALWQRAASHQVVRWSSYVIAAAASRMAGTVFGCYFWRLRRKNMIQRFNLKRHNACAEPAMHAFTAFFFCFERLILMAHSLKILPSYVVPTPNRHVKVLI